MKLVRFLLAIALIVILSSFSVFAATYIQEEGSAGKYAFWDSYGTQHDLETPFRSGYAGNWQTAIYDPNTQQAPASARLPNLDVNNTIHFEHTYLYTADTISVQAVTNYYDTGGTPQQNTISHSQALNDGVPQDFSVQVSNLKGTGDLGFTWELQVKGTGDAAPIDITDAIEGIPQNLVYGENTSGGLLFDNTVDFAGKYTGDLEQIIWAVDLDPGALGAIGYGNNRVIQAKSSDGISLGASAVPEIPMGFLPFFLTGLNGLVFLVTRKTKK